MHQAHKTGAPDTKLAVKVLRPRIDRKVSRDLATFRVIARWIEKLMPTARRLRPVDAIDTLTRSLEAETDLRREAAALEEMAYNARNDEGFCVPDVLWEGTGRRVLTMSWVDGIPASDVDALRAAKLDLPDSPRGLFAFSDPCTARRVFPCRHASGQFADPERRHDCRH